MHIKYQKMQRPIYRIVTPNIWFWSWIIGILITGWVMCNFWSLKSLMWPKVRIIMNLTVIRRIIHISTYMNTARKQGFSSEFWNRICFVPIKETLWKIWANLGAETVVETLWLVQLNRYWRKTDSAVTLILPLCPSFLILSLELEDRTTD